MKLHSLLAPTFAYLFAYHSNRGLAGKINVNPNEFGDSLISKNLI